MAKLWLPVPDGDGLIRVKSPETGKETVIAIPGASQIPHARLSEILHQQQEKLEQEFKEEKRDKVTPKYDRHERGQVLREVIDFNRKKQSGEHFQIQVDGLNKGK